jgi:hypothetical protein
VAGSPATVPRYRLVASVPEGQYDDERRAAVVASMTDAVLDAESGTHPRDANRVWVITHEIPDGTWGGRGRIMRLPDIAAFVVGDRARPLAAERLARRRRDAAVSLVAAASEVASQDSGRHRG